jgi:hypothetical protein
MAKVIIRKHLGDDAYSWAVFVDGRPVLTGQSRREAQYERDRIKRERGIK